MTNDETLARDVGIALVHMIRRAEEAQERAARQGGIHPTDFRCIGYLKARGGPVSPKHIIAYLGLTSGTGTALIDRLERAGLITRVPNPDDRRSVLVVLNPEGAASIVALHDHILQRYAEATANFSDENLKAIAKYLRSVDALSAEFSSELYDDVRPLDAAS